ncbi:PadR family transcriptional regulator [Agrococcus sp. Ld7]|uniref:PadR family transcriptional regulator n=1 Tax=Agrococcus sp. Ld7 TaxID=649148 RepID=UPI003865D97E
MVRPLARMTPATLDVLSHLVAQDAPTWGLEIAGATGRPTGSVYPILERLESHGWVVSDWEAGGARPGARRRLYRLTPDARDAAMAALQRARAAAASEQAKAAAAAPARRPRPALGGAA